MSILFQIYPFTMSYPYCAWPESVLGMQSSLVSENSLCRNGVNPFMPNGPFYFNALDRSISKRKGLWSGFFFILPRFIEMHVFNANSVDHDQTPHIAASDLGLHCLPVALLWDT